MKMQHSIFEQPLGEHGQLVVYITRQGKSPTAILHVINGVQHKGEIETRPQETGVPATGMSDTAESLFSALKAKFRSSRVTLKNDSKSVEEEGEITKTVTLNVGGRSNDVLCEIAEETLAAVSGGLSLTRYARTTDEDGGRLADR